MVRKKKQETEAALEQKKTPVKRKKESKSDAGDYLLIITEKPQAALKIAEALAEGSPAKKVLNAVSYYELTRGGVKILVACAVGHLFTLTTEEKGFPIFNISWQPNYKVKKADFTKKYYTTLMDLSKNAKAFIVATDYDIEGELIGYNILRFVCKTQNAKRMKFSTLTAPDITEAYNKPMDTIDYGLAVGGETRHILDWYYGINLSRALMNALSKVGAFRIMSVGRVQGPALYCVVKKEREILAFRSKPYWQVYLMVKNSHTTEVKYEKDLTKESELARFRQLKGKDASAVTEKQEQSIPPGLPFDLTTLQLEAFRHHGIKPAQLLQIAQQLYLAGYISYPRTSSQKLPASIGYDAILKKLARNFPALTKKVSRKIPLEGKKQDAHPAIFPTGESGELSDEQKKVYELIVRRFCACFCADAVVENKKITVTVDGLEFSAHGLAIKEEGWMSVYKGRVQDKELPDINGAVNIKEIRTEEKQTQPPRRYTQASLVGELAKKNLGTKATRASVIDTLYKRGYIKSDPLEATPFGITLIDTLEKEASVIIDEKLTRHFEDELILIEKNKEKETIKENVLKEAQGVITKISEEFRKNYERIGKQLLSGYEGLKEQERAEQIMMTCEKCEKGNIIIRVNKSQGKQFLACDKYPECRNTYSLPYGFIKKSGKDCECGFPMLLSIKKGKRPWEFCFNPSCTKKQKTPEPLKESP